MTTHRYGTTSQLLDFLVQHPGGEAAWLLDVFGTLKDKHGIWPSEVRGRTGFALDTFRSWMLDNVAPEEAVSRILSEMNVTHH